MTKQWIYVGLGLCALAVPATAKEAVARNIATGNDCKMVETVTVGANFNLMAETLAEAKKKFDDKLNQLTNFAKDQKIEKFEPQSMNYNIYAQNNNNTTSYQLNGSVSYQLKSTEEAFRLAEFLEKQKFNVNVNSNSYRQGNCNN